MPAERLVSTFNVALAGGATLTVNHLLKNGNGRALVPTNIWPNRATPILVSAATSTQVTFQNPLADPAVRSATFTVAYLHTIQRDPARDAAVISYWQGNEAVGVAANLQATYDAGGAGQQIIQLDNVQLGIALRDAVAPLGVTLLEVTDSTGATQFIQVDPNGVTSEQGLTLVNSTVAVSPANAIRFRSSGGVAQVSQNGAAYVALSSLGSYTVDPQALLADTDTISLPTAMLALKSLTSAANRLLGSTPTLPAGTSGQTVILHNSNAQGSGVTIAVQSDPNPPGDLTGSLLALELGTITMGPQDSIPLIWVPANARWQQYAGRGNCI